ncbi:MAG: phosphoadenylyl-sulfate reductase [Planctomycetia bacterium]|nr:phosphoadenylyl-sulfate reductase [Planctomycetia bacterium]
MTDVQEVVREAPADADAKTLLAWAVEQFGDKVALASSFNAEDMVLIDILSKVTPKPRVFAIDPGRLHEETYEVMEEVRRKYGIAIELYFPDTAKIEELERTKGLYSFRESLEDRHECCSIRKVEPLQRALAKLDAWITGLRHDQSVTRTRVAKVEIDELNGGIAKINPLVDWTADQVAQYIRENDVPYNKLNDCGYPSIGCAPCTRAIKPGEHPRAGRWWWESPEEKECGLHKR